MQTARTVGLEMLEKHLDRAAIRQVVREAIIAHAQGETISPMPGELLFDQPAGDCHIKFGRILGYPRFTVKVVTGFYDNPSLGLPVNSGAVMVLSAQTGTFEAIIFDDGWLTAWRAAAAGSLASRAMARRDARTVAIVGSGQQAEQQAIWHADVFDGAEFIIGARDPQKAGGLAAKLRAAGVNARAETTILAAVARADIIVTTTPAPAPLFSLADVRPGTHITALGADAHGKQELDPALLARARIIATDDHAQCADHGEFGAALRLRLVAADRDVALGSLLASPVLERGDADITIADLTGLAAQDIAIASFFMDRLERAMAPKVRQS